MVALPRELDEAGYMPGTSVLIERLPDGTLHLLPAAKLRERIREIGRQVYEDREALELLAEHDRQA